jgi:hypothetical protein
MFNSDADTHEGTELDGMARTAPKLINLHPESSQDTGTAGDSLDCETRRNEHEM